MLAYSIGFTQKKAEQFFNLIASNNIKTLIDVRLNNTSQLSGFAKKDDLKYFLKELCDCEYMHVPDLAPTKEMLKPYQKGVITWEVYEERFYSLMAQRNIEKYLDANFIDQGCLLCSEHLPHHCHRRLVLEYLNKFDESMKIKHLVK